MFTRAIPSGVALAAALCPMPAVAQVQPEPVNQSWSCGLPELREEFAPLRELHHELIERRLRLEEEQRRGAAAAAEGDFVVGVPPIIYVPLTFHVVRRTDGTGGISQAQLDQAVVDANIAFEPMRVIFCQVGATLYFDSDYYYTEMSTEGDFNTLRAVAPVPDTINCYFVEEMTSPYDPSFYLCGMSAYTWSPAQGIVMRNACTGVPLDHATFPHEIAHYFDLFHVHETGFGPECADNRNCSTRGDKLCDTNASKRLDLGTVDESTCQYIGDDFGPCIDDSQYRPDPRNYMSYSPKPCRDFFSPMQFAKARATLIELRPELVNLDPICPLTEFCGAGAGSCYLSHGGPGCDDGDCCEDICDLDPYCCAGDWDHACAWKASLMCRDLTITPPWGPPHAPLGLAALMPDSGGTGHLVLSHIGDSGEDGVVVDLGAAGGYTMPWLPLHAPGMLPIGAHVEAQAVGGSAVVRAAYVGASRAAAVGDGTAQYASITADFSASGADRYAVRAFHGSVLLAELRDIAPPPDGELARASAMPQTGGVPVEGESIGPVPRFSWTWPTPVVLTLIGGPTLTGTRIDVYAENPDAPMPRIEQFALTASGISTIEITGGVLVPPLELLPHDDCSGAIAIITGDTPFSTAGATASGLLVPPACTSGFGVQFGRDIWFSYPASCTGTADVRTCGLADYDTRLAVYAGGCDGLELIACNDDAAGCAGGTSALTFDAECGEHYFVRVGGRGMLTGMGTLRIACTGECPSSCVADLNGNGAIDFTDLLIVLSSWGPCPGCPADLDGSGVVGLEDLLTLLAAWGPCPDFES